MFCILRTIFSYTEEQLAKTCGSKPGVGTTNENLVKAAGQVGLEVIEVKSDANVPMTLSCHRGLTRKRLQSDGDDIVNLIVKILDGKAEGLSFALPHNDVAPIPVMEKLILKK